MKCRKVKHDNVTHKEHGHTNKKEVLEEVANPTLVTEVGENTKSKEAIEWARGGGKNFRKGKDVMTDSSLI